MTEAADLLLTNGEIHTLADPDETYEALAVRDGRIVRLGAAYEIDFLNGVRTTEIDLAGRVLLPGFVDAHVHLGMVGRYLVNADLRVADSPADCVDLLEERAEGTNDEWVLGFGFDESTWREGERRYPTREDLDRVSEERPVVAFREDMHIAAVNSVVIDRFIDEMPPEDVHEEDGEPTGVIVEEAVDVLYREIEPGPERTRELLLAAQDEANRLGVTGVHDMVRNSPAPGVYRDLELAGDLTLRVRINYWADHLDALIEAGLRTNHGSEFVRTGAIKTFTDGSFGGRTAKLSFPYADGADQRSAGNGSGARRDGAEETGQWVVPPKELEGIVGKADDAGFQVTAHAIGDEAIGAVLDAYEGTADPAGSRHRVEHVELATDEHVERFAESGVVASMQPNFLKWAGEGGLYEARLGAERRGATNRFPTFLDAGVPLAFGSDCMPLDPLLGVHQAVNPPAENQKLSVTDALRAYTLGAAYAGFDEDRLGTVEVGKRADFTVLDRSPWEHPGDIENIEVALTIVDGEVVHDAR